MSVHLERIVVSLPDIDADFTARFTSIIGGLGQLRDRVLTLTRSNQSFYPELELHFRSDCSEPITDFVLSDGEIISITIENTNGIRQASPHVYQPINVKAVSRRLANSGVNHSSARLVNRPHRRKDGNAP